MHLELKTEEERRLVVEALDGLAARNANWMAGVGWVSGNKDRSRSASIAGELAERAWRA